MVKRTCRDEAGSVSALVVGLVMTFIACAGLAVDGGRMVAAKIHASDMAENAARTGAQALTGIRLGVPRIEPRSARRLASAYLSLMGTTGSVEASQQEVCVTIRESKEMTLLSLVGVSSKTVVATRCARAIQGGDR